MNPEELVKITHAARRYYVDDASHVSIAAELGVSRFKIARMIDKARDLGIVRIEVREPADVDTELSLALARRFGLVRAVVARAPSQDPGAIQEILGRLAAQLLEEIVVDGDVLGFTYGRTLDSVARNLTHLPPCDLVALGGVAGPVREHAVEIVRRVADATHGSTHPVFAPLLVQSPETATALRSDPLIAGAFTRLPDVTKGVVAIGSWDPPNSQLYDAAKDAGIVDELLQRGVVGEVAATLFDAEGTLIPVIDDRTIAITADQLRAVPEVIAVAGGRVKARAMLGALRAGLVRSVVTDTELARDVLTLAGEAP